MQFRHASHRRRCSSPMIWSALLAFCLLAALAGSDAAAATTLTGPATLATPNETYIVANDFSCPGSAFTITASGITLDLGGHTVTYGTASGTSHGVVAGGSTSDLIIKNGTLQQGAANGTACHGISLGGSTNVEISQVKVTVQGPDTSNIFSYWGGLTHIHHCLLYNNNTVISNRHSGPGGMIELNRNKGGTSVHDCELYNGPWQGIRVSTHSTAYDGGFQIYNNRISHKTKYANAYAIWTWGRNSDIWGNTIIAEGRGITVTYDPLTCKPGGYWLVHDNYIDVKERPNEEYSTRYWVHGIKFEARGTEYSSGTTKIYNNTVIARAEPGFGEARALDLTMPWPNEGLEVHHNNITAVTTTGELDAIAFQATGITEDSGGDIHDNVFTSNATILKWCCGSGVLLRSNVLRRGANPINPRTIKFNVGADSVNNILLDTTVEDGASLNDVVLGGHANSYYVQWYLDVAVQEGDGAPVPDASVTITDAEGTVVYAGSTDSSGRIPRQALNEYLASGTSTTVPTKRMYTPHTVAVSKAGYGEFSATVTMDHSQSLTVAPLALIKSADRTAAGPGDTVTYTLVCRNLTGSPMSDVVITDPIPEHTTYVAGSATGDGAFSGGVVTWNIGTLAADAERSVSFQVTVD